jgi:hypothetical protein
VTNTCFAGFLPSFPSHAAAISETSWLGLGMPGVQKDL